MIIWVDAQLSPVIAEWIDANFSVSAIAVRDLGLRDAEDEDIFLAAKHDDAIFVDQRQRFCLVGRSNWGLHRE